ncbi:MAG TPA: hypothetical protein PLU07_05570 [Ferruginibacter sp.]|nr:hypothetical protein [Ferruginibacter sp.]
MMHCTLWPGFKLNAKRIRATAMVSLLFLASSVTKGQISFTPGSNTISIDFSNTTPASVGTNTGTAFTAAGFSPNPTNAQAGRLNSNAWSVRGISDGTLNFGGTSTSGDAARGSFATSQSVGGVYAYVGTPATTTNPMMMIQPAADDFTPGSLVLRFRNDDPVLPITAVQLTYDVWVRNDAGRSQTIRINRSIDDVNYTNEPAFDYNTPEAISGSTVVSAGTFSQNMTDFDVPATYFGYIQWAIDDDTTGSGNRDEIVLDNIQITVTYGPPCTPPDPCRCRSRR